MRGFSGSSLMSFILIFLVFAPVVDARLDFATASGKSCDFCHSEGPPSLNDAGKYYQQHGSLEGYISSGGPAQEAATPSAQRHFGENCSTCHIKQLKEWMKAGIAYLIKLLHFKKRFLT